MTRPVWIDPPPIPGNLPALHPSPLLHELLARRGFATAAAAAEFLDPSPRHAPDPAGMPNLQAAVDRIGSAIDRGEGIGIFGDYDADGVTATALLTRALRCATADPERVIPRLPRRDEGYGLNRTAIDELAATGAGLLIAVDCGSSDPEHVEYARAAGMEVVVLDHHQIPADALPEAIVVSAQLPGGEGLRDLCSAGVAYMVVVGLARDGYEVGGPRCEPETSLLDLVALGTIADVMPVAGINRALVRDGLARVRAGQVGLAALGRQASLDLTHADPELVSFKLGPRLNAAGRMDDPRVALDLLLADDPRQAAFIAAELESLNKRRRDESAKVLAEAERTIGADKDLLRHSVLIVRGRGWPSGLLGPASAQLVERYGRPAIVLSDDGERSHGSARSVPGFDLAGALQGAADLLVRFGGHAQAAGLAIRNEHLPALRERLEVALERDGVALPLAPELRFDAEIAPKELTLETAELIEQLQPFGAGNEPPLLRVRGLSVRAYDAVGADKRHLRLQLGYPGGSAKAIGFGMGELSKELVRRPTLDIAAVMKIDRWGGQRRLDLHLVDFRASE